MLEAFFEAADPAVLDHIAPYAPSGVMAVLVWVLNRIVSPVVEAAKAVKTHFDEAGEHREAETMHWRREEELLQEVVDGMVLQPDGDLKVVAGV